MSCLNLISNEFLKFVVSWAGNNRTAEVSISVCALNDKTTNNDGNIKHNVQTMFFVKDFILIKDLTQVLRIKTSI